MVDSGRCNYIYRHIYCPPNLCQDLTVFVLIGGFACRSTLFKHKLNDHGDGWLNHKPSCFIHGFITVVPWIVVVGCWRGSKQVPYTLAENAGMQPVEIVTQLRAAHAKGEKSAGINVKTLGQANRTVFFCSPLPGHPTNVVTGRCRVNNTLMGESCWVSC
jgi:hypothetical protein